MPFLDRPYGRLERFTARSSGAEKNRKWGQPEEIIGTVSGRAIVEEYNRYFKFLCTWAGYLAARQDKPLSNNPHGVGTPMYGDWRRGWLGQRAGKKLGDL